MDMRVTRKDVALRAGVSEASVSYVLNRSRKVSDVTIKKVMESVRELDYSVDMVARSMVKKETRQLAILANDLSNPYFSEIFLGFENVAIDNGYLVSICTGQREIEKYISDLIARRIDGVFITAMPYMPYDKYYDIITNMVRKGVKVVISGHILGECEGLSHIEPMYEMGMVQALLYLKGLGHKDVAMISTIEQNSKIDSRDQIFFRTMDRYFTNSKKIYVSESETHIPAIEKGYQLMLKLLNEHKDVTAVLCINDMMAFGAINAAMDVGLRIPEDISIIGIDNVSIAEMFRPSLSSIGFDKIDYGKQAFQLLHKLIKSNESENVVVPTNLFTRKSTATAKPQVK